MTSANYSEWLAPEFRAPLNATVTLPGSKSLTNREFLLAALASEPTEFAGALISRDAKLMLGALSALGAGVTGGDTTSPTITPATLDATASIDCGLAGTVMRFVPPLSTLNNGRITFDGDEGARRRPMDTTITSLRALGVSVEAESLSLPFTVVGTGSVEGGDLTIDASSSSQFVSGLLLVAPRFKNGLTLRHEGEHLPSLPHIEMTLECLRQRGVEFVESPGVQTAQRLGQLDLMTPPRWILLTSGDDLRQHVLHIAGNRDFMHRVSDFAVFHPETAGTARVVARHVIHALPHQLNHKQTCAEFLQHGF
jgi:3-phosphoshikimate 1-carboxyvinyltransferase